MKYILIFALTYIVANAIVNYLCRNQRDTDRKSCDKTAPDP